jgi:chromosome partitioning protein
MVVEVYMKIYAVASQKGGVGKTSLVQNLGYELSLAGKRVLIIDFDPQSNLTFGFGLAPEELEKTIYTALIEPKKTNSTIINIRKRLDLIPASLDLAGAELAFAGAILDGYSKLREVIKQISGYDIILIDCPPTLGFFTINALAAATDVLIPLQTHAYAYKAIDQLLPIIEQVRERANPKLRLCGIVLTMFDVRNNLSIAVADQARKRFDGLVYENVVPVNVRVAESPLDGKAVAEVDPESRGSRAYRAIAKEVLSGKAK